MTDTVEAVTNRDTPHQPGWPGLPAVHERMNPYLVQYWTWLAGSGQLLAPGATIPIPSHHPILMVENGDVLPLPRGTPPAVAAIYDRATPAPPPGIGEDADEGAAAGEDHGLEVQESETVEAAVEAAVETEEEAEQEGLHYNDDDYDDVDVDGGEGARKRAAAATTPRDGKARKVSESPVADSQEKMQFRCETRDTPPLGQMSEPWSDEDS